MSDLAEWRREREKEEELERERALREVIIRNNRYGYTLNLRNPRILALYEAYKRSKGIHGAPSDYERYLWETAAKTHICAEYERMYRTKLYQPVIGWQRDNLEECVRVMDVEKSAERILQLTANKKVCKKAGEIYLAYRKEYIKK